MTNVVLTFQSVINSSSQTDPDDEDPIVPPS
jgi:hypothetical protein